MGRFDPAAIAATLRDPGASTADKFKAAAQIADQLVEAPAAPPAEPVDATWSLGVYAASSREARSVIDEAWSKHGLRGDRDRFTQARDTLVGALAAGDYGAGPFSICLSGYDTGVVFSVSTQTGAAAPGRT